MSKNWPTVKLSDVVTPADRAEAPVAGTTYRQIGVKLWGEGAYEREAMDGAQTKYSRLFRAEAGDIIVNKIWARNGSVAVVPPSLAGCYGSGEFPMFMPKPGRLDSRWMHWLTKTRDFWTQCDEKSRGTSGKNRIKPEQFLRVEIPLPSTQEQRRVVERIETLAARIKDAQSLRQQTAEEADALSYASLRQTRRRLSDSSHTKAHLGSVTTITAGGTPSRDNPTFWNGDIPWIKTGELLDGDISSAEEHITQAGVENSSAKVFPSETVLIALYGQGQTRGRTGRLMFPAATNQACCAILPKPEKFEPRYIQFWLRSLYVELREAAQGGAQPNWNGAMIKDLEVTLPPLPEQRQIVAYLDNLQEQTNALEASQTESSTELDALMPSILDKAFRGEL